MSADTRAIDGPGPASALGRLAIRVARPGAAAGVLIVLFLLATYTIATGSAFTQSLFTVAAVYAILAVSLDLVAGVIGLYSLGHAGLFAIGAYGTTLLATERGWNIWLLLPASIVGVGIVGLFIGALALRVSGLYFAITTFVFTLLITALLTDLSFTGGLGGLIGPLFPEFAPGLSWLGASLVWATMLSLLVVTLISFAIRRSPFYSVLLAIRDAEPMAGAAGARTALIKVAMFGLSASMAGLAGWLFSFQGIISPGQFSWTLSVNVLVMVILGGMNSLLGPIIGAAFISIFPAEVHMDPFWQEVLFGALLLAVIVVVPRGFVGIVALVLRRVTPLREPLRPALSGPALVGAETSDGRASHPPVAAGAAPQAVAIDERPADERSARRAVERIARGNGAGKGVPAIECHDVAFSYGGGINAVDGVDFTVSRGTIHGLIGPNGSGKSTLVDLIAGRLRPDRGSIAINGDRVDGQGPSSRPSHGFMRTFQTAVLVDDRSCRDNVLVGLYSRIPRLGARAPVWPLLPSAWRDGRRMRQQANDALSFAGVGEWAGTEAGAVPHAVEQLTQLAVASVAAPNVLVLDEPVAGLSASEIERVRERLSDLRSAGASILLIEHQPRFVFELCDEVTVLSAGQVVTTGPSTDVRANTRVREVYLGQ